MSEPFLFLTGLIIGIGIGLVVGVIISNTNFGDSDDVREGD